MNYQAFQAFVQVRNMASVQMGAAHDDPNPPTDTGPALDTILRERALSTAIDGISNNRSTSPQDLSTYDHASDEWVREYIIAETDLGLTDAQCMAYMRCARRVANQVNAATRMVRIITNNEEALDHMRNVLFPSMYASLDADNTEQDYVRAYLSRALDIEARLQTELDACRPEFERFVTRLEERIQQYRSASARCWMHSMPGSRKCASRSQKWRSG